MSLLDTYKSLSHSNRNDVGNTLKSIATASPLTLPIQARDGLVLALLNDINDLMSGKKDGRLSIRDAQPALFALKMLGRQTVTSRVISRRENLSILLKATEGLRAKDSDAADEALRCVANALLLVEEGRTTWIEIQGADHCLDLLEKAKSTVLIFLSSRILFLCTASSSSPYLQTLLNGTRTTGAGMDKDKQIAKTRNDIVVSIASQLDYVLDCVRQDMTMCKEAMTDLLKFSFNLLCHWPKLDTSEASKSDGKASRVDDDGLVLGERWTDRLDGFLPPLRRIFLGLPLTKPSPLTSPLTHVLHSLLPVPITPELYFAWFPELTDASGIRSSRSGSPVTTSAGNGKDKEKSKEERNAFDRAIQFLTSPRASLSRPSSPHSPGSPGSGSDTNLPNPSKHQQGPPAILTRALEILELSFKHYLPDNVDPDDQSVKQRCRVEDVELDHVLSPLLLLLVKLCKHSMECRLYLRERLLPATLDRTSPLEGRPDTLGRCIRLMSCISHPQLKDASGELLFAICDSDAQNLCVAVGYGNAAGFLFNKGIMTAPPAPSQSEGLSVDSNVNPITGMVNQERPPEPEMTEEEKEREAEKLFVLFERLEKAGGMENPIRKALHEGKLEKYQQSSRKGDDSD